MNSSRFFIILLPILLPAVPMFLSGQSEYMDRDQHGMGTEIVIGLTDTEIEYFGLAAGYSMNGLLDIGLDLEHDSGETGLEGEVTYSLAADYTFTLLKQDRLVPVSIVLPGSLRTMLVTGDAIENDGLVKTGTGYRIGLDIFRYFYAVPRLYIRYGVFLSHESTSFIIEKKDGSTGGGYPTSQKNYDLFYGAILGFSFRPNRPHRGIAFSMDLKMYTDSSVESLSIAPSLSLTLVENDLDGGR